MTAVQELIDWAISLQYNQQQCTDWIVIKNKAESLLQMEKQQIEEAFKHGRLPVLFGELTAEQYYQETFKK